MMIEQQTDVLINQLARLAQQAILYEAMLSPKPGLVDTIDSGSHTDMDIYTFLDSAAALYKGFVEFAEAGFRCEGSEKELFQIIRPIGMKCEEDMFAATQKVNTHKGIIFSLGIVLAAVSRYLKENPAALANGFSQEDTNRVFTIIQAMTEGIVQNDFQDLEGKQHLTHGEKLYLQYGFTGIRGEAENGYPVIRDKVLPVMRKEGGGFASRDDLLLEALFLIMASTEDSNVVNRGGISALTYVQEEAQAFLDKGGMRRPEAYLEVAELNEAFIVRNISPGGAADLLSLFIFFAKLENII